jgi:hypothetical protein
MREPIPQDVALRLQLAAIAGGEPESSLIEMRPLTPDSRPVPAERAWLPVRDADGLTARVAALAPAFNVYLGVAPRVRQGGRAADVERVWVLWVDLDGREALERLRAFRPLPSIVIRTGSTDSAHAYWPLREPLPPSWAQRANRRLQLRLGADPAATDPARILRPAGSLNHKHGRPREVVCTRLETDVFTFDEVVGRLPDTEHYRPGIVRTAEHRISAEPSRVLAGIVRTITAKGEGERNHTLNWAAYRAGQHIAHGELDEGLTIAELRSAAEHVGLPDFEIERTLASGINAGKSAA